MAVPAAREKTRLPWPKHNSKLEEYDPDEYVHEEAYTAYGPQQMVPMMQHMMTQAQHTSKIAPMFDGKTSWFAYEEAIDNWCDVTEVPAAKHGPSLRNRLVGEAAIYQKYLDRDLLEGPRHRSCVL